MKKEGLAALAHKNRGRKPKHAVLPEVREKIVALAIQDYQGASWAHMAELLEEREKIRLSWKTVGRILKRAHVSNPHDHRRPRRHRTRERMPQEGMLIQCDASPHDWLEERGPRLSLHGGIDDATSKIMGLCFRLEEDLIGYFNLLEQIVLKKGIPLSFYSDRHTIFLSPKKDKLSIAEELAGVIVPLTQFGQALEALGIRYIPARSPQAKGRIERLWGTLQHRLIVEMRLANISTLEEANAFLPAFIQRFNRCFAVEAAKAKKAYRPKPNRAALEEILCQHHERLADHGSAFSFEGKTYQLLDRSHNVVSLRAKDVIRVKVHRDGRLSASCQGKTYALQAFTKPKPIHAKTTKIRKAPIKPALNHPWRLQAKLEIAKKGVTFSQSG